MAQLICRIGKQTIYDKDVKLTCEKKGTNGLYFSKCIFFEIPSAASIKNVVSRLTCLAIDNSKLNKITSEDLRGLDLLESLDITECQIESLPGDLFIHTPTLEFISFANNKIKYIGEEILDPLQNLKIFDLRGNVNINTRYGIFGQEMTLDELKDEIRTKCKDTSKLIQELRLEIESLKTQQKMEIEIFKAQHVKAQKNHKKEIQKLTLKLKTAMNIQLKLSTAKYRKLENKFDTILQQLHVVNELSKDFLIKVDQDEFKVHKAIITMNSAVLAKMINENPQIDNYELKDISSAAFKEILNFMNSKTPPSHNANMVDLFEACCKLEVVELTKIVEDILKEQVNAQNALDVLLICNKFDNHEELKMKAFAEFQKNFLNQTLKVEMASQPDKLKAIMKAKLDMDELLNKMQVD